MELAAVMHRAVNEFCYAADKDTVVVTLKTAKDVARAFIVHADPFIHELKMKREWFGEKLEMEKYLELERHFIWRIKLKPPYKRLQYYFIIENDSECFEVYDNKITPPEKSAESSKLYFKGY